MTRILAALTCLALTGCVESPVPLESDGGKLSAPELIGLWKFDIDGDPAIATISQDPSGDFKADVIAYWEPGPKIATRHFHIVLARFDKDRYMSIRDLALSPLYSLARYEVESKDRFRLYGAYSEELVEALEKKRLPGELKPDRHMPTVMLNASSEQLRSFFHEAAVDAFDHEAHLVFERTSSTQLPPPPVPGPPRDEPTTPPRP